MKSIKIIHWDDDSITEAWSKEDLVKILSNHSITIERNEFRSQIDEIKSLLKNDSFDLIILDLEESKVNEQQGFDLLNDILGPPVSKNNKNQTPSVLIFSRHKKYKGKVLSFRDSHKIKIDFFDKEDKKSADYWSKLEKCLVDLLEIQQVKIPFTEELDINTKHTISKIGRENIEVILGNLFKIKNQKPEKINLFALTPGFSGAFIFVIKHKTKSSLIKMSNNFEQTIKEFKNLEKYDEHIRSISKIGFERINPIEISYNGWYPIVYEYVSHSQTLFSWLSKIKNKKDIKSIQNVLELIFSDDCLKPLNSVNQEINDPVNENILSELDSSRVVFINNAYEELKTIFSTKHNDIIDKENLLDKIIENHLYGSITNSKIKKRSSIQILSHNDLHANNILLDSRNNPILIDPGSLNYKHWSSDICRLLVDLIIRGVDYNKIVYFKIETIKKWLPQIINIIKGDEEIKFSQNDTNLGFFIAINWLRFNADKIYSDHYVKWEFQLGLAVEFLKSCYKSVSLPPGKRALALLAACEAVKLSNESLKEFLKKDKKK